MSDIRATPDSPVQVVVGARIRVRVDRRRRVCRIRTLRVRSGAGHRLGRGREGAAKGMGKGSKRAGRGVSRHFRRAHVCMLCVSPSCGMGGRWVRRRRWRAPAVVGFPKGARAVFV
ncbi:hypothetical protein B0H19DRAFT_1202740 [Mycena capillaripes]|nr:hypothetical protein B0H19DRAFT_1202740 [Mycena capillaripes]